MAMRWIRRHPLISAIGVILIIVALVDEERTPGSALGSILLICIGALFVGWLVDYGKNQVLEIKSDANLLRAGGVPQVAAASSPGRSSRRLPSTIMVDNTAELSALSLQARKAAIDQLDLGEVVEFVLTGDSESAVVVTDQRILVVEKLGDRDIISRSYAYDQLEDVTFEPNRSGRGGRLIAHH